MSAAKEKETERKDAPKRGKTIRRDINEQTPLNWQRKPHLADGMPLISDIKSQTKELLETEKMSFNANEFVYLNPEVPELDLASLYDKPPTFHIGRILQFKDKNTVVVNMLKRPSEVFFREPDSRQLFATFEVREWPITAIRGKLFVQSKHEIRNLDNFKSKPSQYYISDFYDTLTAKLLDIVPLTNIKRLGPDEVKELGTQCTHLVLYKQESADLCQPQRKKKTGNGDTTFEDKETKSVWPFKFYSKATGLAPERQIYRNFSQENTDEVINEPDWTYCPKVGSDYQVDIDEWQGCPLSYYTKTADGECLLVDDGTKADISKPHVQEMPGGYLNRGGEATATLISEPLPGIDAFISKCQAECTPQLECEPYNLNFLNECASEFTISRGDVTQSLIRVSKLTKRGLGITDMNSSELEKFKRTLNPFLKNSWHYILNNADGKSAAELSHFFWTSFQPKLNLPLEKQVLTDLPYDQGTDESLSTDYFCGMCNTSTTCLWYRLPAPMPLPFDFEGVECEINDRSAALCARCARLWYKYDASWMPYTLVDKLTSGTTDKEHKPNVESELLEDSKLYKIQEQKRNKRLQAVAEKKEAGNQAKLDKKETRAGDKRTASEDSKATSAKSTPKKAKLKDSESKPAKSKGKPKDSNSELSEPKPAKPAKKESTTKKNKAGDKPNDETQESADIVKEEKPKFTMSEDGLEEILKLLNTNQTSESSPPQYCCVCGQLDQSMEQNICVSCGMSVHCACYGAKPNSSWLCDCCSNSRLVENNDSSYKCQACPSTMPHYSEWLSGSPTNLVVDALKRTLDGGWCHIRCAVFLPDIKFNNASMLEGISVVNGDDGKVCTICDKHQERSKDKQSVMGQKLKCHLCKETFHVSCGIANQYRFGFSKGEDPVPVVVCNQHSDAMDITPFSFIDSNFNMTAMQLYVRTHKQAPIGGHYKTAKEQFNEYTQQVNNSTSSIERLNFPLPQTNTMASLFAQEPQTCVNCEKSDSLVWFNTPEGTKCSLCHANMGPVNMNPDLTRVLVGSINHFFQTALNGNF